MSKTNNKKTNVIINFEQLHNELKVATCKNDMVNAYQKNGIKVTTAPTTTLNTNDLYAQFRQNKCGDESRLQTTKTRIKLFVSNALRDYIVSKNDKLVFVDYNDGSIRKNQLVVSNTLENFTEMLQYFIDFGIVETM
ncbi:MAG: hypothetical protein IKP50_00455 [Bacilli bacterium]|nr:hypothetical protein [Bacilli bacterium]